MALPDLERLIGRLARLTVQQQSTVFGAGEVIPPLRVVRLVGDTAFVCTGFNGAYGFSFAGAALGAPCTVFKFGSVPGGNTTNQAIGIEFWLLTTGAVTIVKPTVAGSRLVLIGYATSQTPISPTADVLIDVQDLGVV